MPPAFRRQCDYPGCRSGPPGPNGEENPFITCEDLARREDLATELDKHVEMAHLLPIRLEENRTKTIKAEAQSVQAEANRIHEETQRIFAQTAQAQQSSSAASPSHSSGTSASLDPSVPKPFLDKMDALPRPTIQENSSGADWSFFKTQWSWCMQGSNMTAQQQVHHLWASCTQSLQRSLQNSGAHNLTDPKLLMEDIRLLAVKQKNNLVNVVELQRMGQGAQETITQYTSRLMGQGDICNFTIQCSEHDVSFRDPIIMYQFIRGISDIAAQERILKTAAQVEGGELTLACVLKIAEAFEMGRASHQQVNQGGQ